MTGSQSEHTHTTIVKKRIAHLSECPLPSIGISFLLSARFFSFNSLQHHSNCDANHALRFARPWQILYFETPSDSLSAVAPQMILFPDIVRKTRHSNVVHRASDAPRRHDNALVLLVSPLKESRANESSPWGFVSSLCYFSKNGLENYRVHSVNEPLITWNCIDVTSSYYVKLQEITHSRNWHSAK